MTNVKISMTGGYEVFCQGQDEQFKEFDLPSKEHRPEGIFRVRTRFNEFTINISSTNDLISICQLQRVSYISQELFQTVAPLNTVPDELNELAMLDARALYFAIYAIVNNKPFVY